MAKGRFGKIVEPTKGRFGKVVSGPELTKESKVEYKAGLFGPKMTVDGKKVTVAEFSKMLQKMPEPEKQRILDLTTKQLVQEELAAGAKGAITTAEIGGSFVAPYASPAIFGVGETARAKIEGKTTPEALKRGATAATVDAALILTTLGLGKVLGAGGRLFTRALKRVPKSAMAQATKNPTILTKPQKPVADIADDILKAVKGLKGQADDALDEGLKKLPIGEGKTVSTRTVANQLNKYGIDANQFAALLKREAKRQLRTISDDIVDAFVRGKKVTFKQAREVNSLLSATVRDLQRTPIAGLGGGAIGRIEAIKGATMKSIEKAVPGTKKLFRAYAVNRSLSEQVSKQVISSGNTVKEGTLRQIAQTLSGGAPRRVKEARRLLDLERRSGVKFIETLKDSVAREAFDQEVKGLSGIALRTVAAGSGGLIGGTAGGPMGAAAGGVLGLAVPDLLTPGVIGAGIKGARLVPKLLKPAAVPAKAFGVQGISRMLSQ